MSEKVEIITVYDHNYDGYRRMNLTPLISEILDKVKKGIPLTEDDQEEIERQTVGFEFCNPGL